MEKNQNYQKGNIRGGNNGKKKNTKKRNNL